MLILLTYKRLPFPRLVYSFTINELHRLCIWLQFILIDIGLYLLCSIKSHNLIELIRIAISSKDNWDVKYLKLV